MNFVITGTENIPTYLAIIGFTFVFSFFTWFCLFKELDIHEVKYTKKLQTEVALANFLKSAVVNHLVACITVTAFTTAIIVPPPFYALDFNQIAFGVNFT